MTYHFEIDALRPEDAAEILWAMKRGDVVRYAYRANLGWDHDPDRWLGNAMRRLAVKYSAISQEETATRAAPSQGVTLPPAQAHPVRNRMPAMDTKMSLKPVISRNCSSSTIGDWRALPT